MDFYNTNGGNLNGMWDSNKFPKFEPGTNIISWSGDIAVTSIIPRWRTL